MCARADRRHIRLPHTGVVVGRRTRPWRCRSCAARVGGPPMTSGIDVRTAVRTPVRGGWRTVTFGDVARQVKTNADPATSGLDRYVAGEHMDSNNLLLARWGTVGDGYVGPAFHRRFAPGQVLYGSRRTYLRKVAVATFDGICANTTFVIEPAEEALLPEFLPYVMVTEAFH